MTNFNRDNRISLEQSPCDQNGPWKWQGFISRCETKYPCGCGSKNRYQNGTLVSGNMDQNLRNPSCLILSHTHVYSDCLADRLNPRSKKGAGRTGSTFATPIRLKGSEHPGVEYWRTVFMSSLHCGWKFEKQKP